MLLWNVHDIKALYEIEFVFLTLVQVHSVRTVLAS